jgi:hypothetical protein
MTGEDIYLVRPRHKKGGGKKIWRSKLVMRTFGRKGREEHRIWDGMKWHVYHTKALFLIRGKTALLGFDKIGTFCCDAAVVTALCEM